MRQENFLAVLYLSTYRKSSFLSTRFTVACRILYLRILATVYLALWKNKSIKRICITLKWYLLSCNYYQSKRNSTKNVYMDLVKDVMVHLIWLEMIYIRKIWKGEIGYTRRKIWRILNSLFYISICVFFTYGEGFRYEKLSKH